MQRTGVYVLIVITAWSISSVAQNQTYSVSIFGTFTTSSKLFHHPQDLDESLRNQFLPLDNVFSGGLDIRRWIEFLRLSVGVSAEYLQKTETFSTPVRGSSVPVVDGYRVVPIELSGYFAIPIGTERIHLYMGGGAGMYLGQRHYRFANVTAETAERNLGFGIHILSGVEYFVVPLISLRSEVKFRDVQFETKNRFSSSLAWSGSESIALDPEPFPSRVNIDGMALHVGLAVHF